MLAFNTRTLEFEGDIHVIGETEAGEIIVSASSFEDGRVPAFDFYVDENGFYVADPEGEAIDKTHLEILDLAIEETAEMFVEEFGEAFDPEDSSDWDATAFQTDKAKLHLQTSQHLHDILWSYYGNALVEKTKQLVAE